VKQHKLKNEIKQKIETTNAKETWQRKKFVKIHVNVNKRRKITHK